MLGLGLWYWLMIIVIAILIVIPYRMVWRKAGFNPNLGFLMLIPLINIFMLWFLALVRWPSLKKIKQSE